MAKDKTLIFGRHPVLDALKAGQNFDKLFLQRGLRGNYEEEIFKRARLLDIPVQVVPKEKLNRMTGGNHQGVIGLLSLVSYYKLEQLLPLIYEQSDIPLIVLMDGITDVRNFGAIARTAECLGAHALVTPAKGAAAINAEAIKSSAGALLQLPVCREKSIAVAIDILKMSGIQVFASDLSAKRTIQAIDFTGPTAIILGSEGKGIHPKLRSMADETFIIPQYGKTDSFNVSVAAGIILYEVSRQRSSLQKT